MGTPGNAKWYVLKSGEGQAVWFPGAHVTFLAMGEETNNQYELAMQWGERGYGPPLHLHLHGPEWFYVVEGEVTFAVEDQVLKASAGSFLLVPAKVKHAFRVDSPSAKFLTWITPPGLVGFFKEAGQPAESYQLPPPSQEPPDVERIEATMVKYGMKILGPPLATE